MRERAPSTHAVADAPAADAAESTRAEVDARDVDARSTTDAGEVDATSTDASVPRRSTIITASPVAFGDGRRDRQRDPDR
jgi:hypothetical protein